MVCFNCNQCDSTFSNDISLRKHEKKERRGVTSVATKPGRGVFNCNQCDSTFSNDIPLRKHEKKERRGVTLVATKPERGVF